MATVILQLVNNVKNGHFYLMFKTFLCACVLISVVICNDIKEIFSLLLLFPLLKPCYIFFFSKYCFLNLTRSFTSW
jgi:hypothetical protein